MHWQKIETTKLSFYLYTPIVLRLNKVEITSLLVSQTYRILILSNIPKQKIKEVSGNFADHDKDKKL